MIPLKEPLSGISRIPTFPNYAVSRKGGVYSLPHVRETALNGGGKFKTRLRRLKAYINNHGYEGVHLYKNGKRYYRTIHKLVASQFVDNPSGRSQINHIDGDKLNNHFTNLEWVSPKENIKHAIDTGLRNGKKKRKSNTI